MTKDSTLFCAFCGKSQHQVRKLVAGPGTHICNECVDLCHDIVHDKPWTPPKPPLEWSKQILALQDIVTDLQSALTTLQLEMMQARYARPSQPEEPAGEIVGFGKREPGQEEP